MVPVVAPTKPECPLSQVGTNAKDNRQMAASSTYTAPISESTSLRYTPEVGAQCISSACWDLCGGCRATGIPTATGKLTFGILYQIKQDSEILGTAMKK